MSIIEDIGLFASLGREGDREAVEGARRAITILFEIRPQTI